MDRRWRALRVGVVASDVIAVVAAHAASAGLRFGVGEVRLGGGELWPVYPVLVGIVTALILTLAWGYGIYRRWALLGNHRVYPKVLSVASFGLVAIIFLSYLLGGPPVVSRQWLLVSWAGTITLMTLSRLVWRQIALYWMRQGRLVRRVLIAGANQHGIEVAKQLNNPERHGRVVVGFLDDYQRPGTLVVQGIPVVGTPADLLPSARETSAEEVIIIAGALTWESQRTLAELVTRPDFPLDARISPTFYDLLTTSAELSHLAYVPMLTLVRSRLSGLNAAAKAVMDVLLSGLMLAALIPVWAVFRLLAWKRGVPMLVQDPVLGFGGRNFEVVGLNRALTRSPVLRRLPALWNIFRQDLSFVGPRPIRDHEIQDHERWLTNLMTMRPGLTGLWRLRAGEMAMDERVALDLYYIRNYTLSLDAQIMFNTARQLWRRLAGDHGTLARWSRVSRISLGERTPLHAVPELAAERAEVSHDQPRVETR